MGHTYFFLGLFSLNRLDGLRRRLIISSHHADIKSHSPPEKYFLGGYTYVCVCMCVDMTYDATIDTGESEIGCDSLGCGVTNI